MRVLVTGSCGLIGSEAVRYYSRRASVVAGIDNNMRSKFFGPDGDTTWVRVRLERDCPHYRHHGIDIRNHQAVASLVQDLQPDLVVHCAAQPSHDRAADLPTVDFQVNAVGTLGLLEAVRQHRRDAAFVFLSTNKVYGDAPNRIAMRELETRWDYADPAYIEGIAEDFTIDQSTHSVFGASKLAADVMVQEYGRYFQMKTVAFRGGCLTGPAHSGAEQHGFLAYLLRAAREGRRYTIYGYKGKQVRDQIHSADVIEAIEAFRREPKAGAVYNLGGGRTNSVSVVEAIDRAEQLLGVTMDTRYSDQHRIGDHICYYTDLRRFQQDYPGWSIQHSLDDILEDLAAVVDAADKRPARVKLGAR